MNSLRRLRALAPDALVALLAEPAGEPVPADTLGAALAARLAGRRARTPRRVDAYDAERGAARFHAPFRWSARAARRTLGTATLRALGDGPATGFLDAARDAVEAQCDRARRGLLWDGALGAWLLAQPAAVRAACAVEAASWATGLSHLLDLGTSERCVRVGVPDAWHEVPGARITLHGRRDAVALDGGRGVLRVRDGAPGPAAGDGLAVDGLVAALATSGDVPARVVGCWPDAGLVLALELDGEALSVGARAILRRAVPSASAMTPVAAVAA